jgi:hypothetical protein
VLELVPELVRVLAPELASEMGPELVLVLASEMGPELAPCRPQAPELTALPLSIGLIRFFSLVVTSLRRINNFGLY